MNTSMLSNTYQNLSIVTQRHLLSLRMIKCYPYTSSKLFMNLLSLGIAASSRTRLQG